MSKILEVLDELAASTKRTMKEKILKRESDNEDLKTVFWAAYNPDITWWISKHPSVGEHSNQSIGTSEAINRILTTLSTRKLTGNAAIGYYRETLELCDEPDAIVIQRVVDRDLRCGVGVPTINKIWPNLVPTYEFQLAEEDPKKLIFPCYVQIKEDGLRDHITVTSMGDVIMRTRGGNVITSLSIMDDAIKAVIPTGETWDGELICVDDYGNKLDRKTSNGILNKAIRGTITPEEASKVIFVVWDIVDQTKTIPYIDRFDRLTNILSQSAASNLHDSKVRIVKNWIAFDLDQVEILFEKALDGGLEGVVAKNLHAVWQPKRTFDLVKFKADKSADLVVTGWIVGTGKNSDRLGALTCRSSDGGVKVNVGIGFSDDDRNWMAPDVILDKIVEVVYNSRITKKGGGVDSLYLPRFKQIRWDKTTANSSDEIK
jgi:hypothetical protein